MWTSTGDNPVKRVISYDDRQDKQLTAPFDDDFKQPFIDDEMEEMIEAMYLHNND